MGERLAGGDALTAQGETRVRTDEARAAEILFFDLP
jgi:hypothetical protein